MATPRIPNDSIYFGSSSSSSSSSTPTKSPQQQKKKKAKNPHKAALLIIDMQTAFYSIATHPSVSQTLIPNVIFIIKAARSEGFKLIFTQHGHAESEFQNPKTQIIKRYGHEESCHIGTPDWELIDEIREVMEECLSAKEGDSAAAEGVDDFTSTMMPSGFRVGVGDVDGDRKAHASDERGEVVLLRKNTYDAFVSTNLEDMLKREGVDKVVIVGMFTQACCESTARGAFDRGFDTWFVEDACAAPSKRLHEMSIEILKNNFGEVVSTKRMISEIEGGLKNYLLQD